MALAIVSAPRSARAAAFAIDLSLRVGPFLVTGGAGYFTTNGWLVRQALPALFSSLVVFTLIDLWGLARRGQSLGKRALRLRIVRENGQRASALRVLGVRTFVPIFFVLVPYFGALWVFLDHLWVLGAERRAVHDLLADTIVIRVEDPDGWTRPSIEPVDRLAV